MPKFSLSRLAAPVFLIAAPLFAQSSKLARVDSMIRAEMSSRAIPGLAVVVVKDGKVIKKTTYGLASIELESAATNATLFQIASATKNVTGVAIMQLVEQGKFRLDDRIADLLPGLPETWRPVTVRHLLSHTSGIPDMILDPNTGVWIPGSPDSVIAQLAKMPIKPAGSEWSYNQTNYMLLGMLIEKVSGLPYRDYFSQRVFKPLGVTNVAFGDSRTVVKGRTSEYTVLGLPKPPKSLSELHAFSYQYPDALYTAAGIFINAEDMARWLVGVSNGATLSPASFTAMTTTVSLNDSKPFHFPDSDNGYGLGWITFDRAAHRAVGGSGGGRAALLFYPEDRLAVAIMTNLQGSGPESLVEMVAKELFTSR